MEQDKGVSAYADRATHEQSQQAVSAVPVGVADALDRAADALEGPGQWTQGMLSRSEGGKVVCFCAMGALIYTGEEHAWAAIDFVERSLPASNRPVDLRPLAKWNDDPGRTQAEVVAMLRAQAIEARRAETAQTGSVADESAVGSADVPNPHRNTQGTK